MDLLSLVEDRNRWWREPRARATLHPYRRALQREVLRRVERVDDRRATVVVGARQVGKSVLLRQTVDDLLSRGIPPANVTYFDFSDARLVQAVGPWEVAAVEPTAVSEAWPRVLLLDEITRSTNWDLWLKQAVDEGGFRIVATDSAASLLRRGAQESGVGRWDELRLEGLSFEEFIALNAEADEGMDEALTRQPNLLERYLALGGFPEHARSEKPDEVRERLRQDVAERTLSDLVQLDVDLDRIRRLLVYLAQESGSILNLEDRAVDLDADRRSVRHWIGLLERTALLAPLEQHTGPKASSRLRSRPKVYVSDHGLVGAFAPSPLDNASVRPKVFEAVVFRHLREVAPALRGELRYFRRNHEIDFVLDLPGRRVAIEVTASRERWREKVTELGRAGSEVEAQSLILVHGGMAETGAAADSRVRPVPLLDFLLRPAALVERKDG